MLFRSDFDPKTGHLWFTDNQRDWLSEDLPEDEKARLEQLRVVHTMQAALFPAMRDCSPEEFAVWHSYPNRSHPLVWHHRSGRKSLVLSTSGAWVHSMPSMSALNCSMACIRFSFSF